MLQKSKVVNWKKGRYEGKKERKRERKKERKKKNQASRKRRINMGAR
jgi:hypothetical protein